MVSLPYMTRLLALIEVVTYYTYLVCCRFILYCYMNFSLFVELGISILRNVGLAWPYIIGAV